jgi:hypothetical protein
VRRFLFFHHKRHPAELGRAEVTAFLDSLAGPAAGATLFQHAEAARALHFLYAALLARPSQACPYRPGLLDSTFGPVELPRGAPAGYHQARLGLV